MPTVQDIKDAIGARKTGLEAGLKGLSIQFDSTHQQIAELQARAADLRDKINATGGAVRECDEQLAAIAELEAKEAAAAADEKAVDDGLPTHMGEDPKPPQSEEKVVE